MRYLVTKEIKTETKVAKKLYLKDLFFILFYISITFMLGGLIYESVRIPYYIFSCGMSIILTAPSLLNPKRRNYMSLLIAFKKKRSTCKPIKNVKNCKDFEEILELLG